MATPTSERLRWKSIDVVGRAAEDWPDQPAERASAIVGFAAGWNASVQAQGIDQLNGWCAGGRLGAADHPRGGLRLHAIGRR